jgi:hypothetical protein
LNDGKLMPKVRATTGIYQNVTLYIHILASFYFSANLSMVNYLPKITIWKPCHSSLLNSQRWHMI